VPDPFVRGDAVQMVGAYHPGSIRLSLDGPGGAADGLPVTIKGIRAGRRSP